MHAVPLSLAKETGAPALPSAPTTTSVRGDRTLTGGSKRTRLTEAELTQKLASMRDKNVALASAHARAQADAAPPLHCSVSPPIPRSRGLEGVR